MVIQWQFHVGSPLWLVWLIAGSGTNTTVSFDFQ